MTRGYCAGSQYAVPECRRPRRTARLPATRAKARDHEGGPITWKGEWHGKSCEDKGVIVRCTPGQVIHYSHFSPLSGAQDIPEDYHKVTENFFDFA